MESPPLEPTAMVYGSTGESPLLQSAPIPSSTTKKPSSSTELALYGQELSDAIPDTATQCIPDMVEALRTSFASGATRDLKTRRHVLKQLQTMLTDKEELICQAVWRDLHKHPTETYACELAMTYLEVQDHLNHLSDWTAPTAVASTLCTVPAFSRVQPEPFGVVCIIGTWNYPINLLFVPLIAAISAGNCAVVRLPGDDTTRCLNNVLIALFEQYIDKRFVRVVYGGIPETQAMLRERYDLIFATGGQFLGKIVAQAAAEYMTPTILEMGGKSPVIVDATANIATAARRVGWGAFINSGQTCVRPDYVLVDEKVGDAFVKALQAQIETFFGEDIQASKDYARVINARAIARLEQVLETDRHWIVEGGDVVAADRFVAPTVLNFMNDRNAFTTSAVMRQELFGPLLPIYYYPSGDLDGCISFITSRPKPLALYAFTTSSLVKRRVVTETSSGSLVINDTMMQLSNPNLPFGGVGASGYGSYHSIHGFRAFSHHKAVLYRYNMLDLPQRYPPYSSTNESILRLVLHPWTNAESWSLYIVGAVVAVGMAVLVGFAIAGRL